MKNKKTKSRTSVAVSEELHDKLCNFSELFNLSIGATAELVIRNGLKNIVQYKIAKLQDKIELLKTFEEDN